MLKENNTRKILLCKVKQLCDKDYDKQSSPKDSRSRHKIKDHDSF